MCVCVCVCNMQKLTNFQRKAPKNRKMCADAENGTCTQITIGYQCICAYVAKYTLAAGACAYVSVCQSVIVCGQKRQYSPCVAVVVVVVAPLAI